MGARGSDKQQASVELPAVNVSVQLEGDAWPGQARTRVEDVTGQRVIVARPGRAGGTPITARAGESLHMSWTADDAMYEVSVVLAAIDDGHVPTWALQPQGAIRRRQRRDSFRLEVHLAATIGTDDTEPALAQVRDLSEGGLRCKPPEDRIFATDDRIWVRLALPDGEVTLDAQVVRVDDHGELGLAFDQVTRTAADQIRKFLFSEQLARRARLAD